METQNGVKQKPGKSTKAVHLWRGKCNVFVSTFSASNEEKQPIFG
jgi:hypothetical protein